MLKYVRYILIVVAVVVSLAYVPRTYAASADLMLVQIQAGGVAAATQELVAIYNNSPDTVNITDYCVLNKSAQEVGCFRGSAPNETRYLPGWSYAVMASTSFVTFSGMSSQAFTTTFDPLSQSSGSITGSSDTIMLVDGTGFIVDQHTWTSTLTAGMVAVRLSTPSYPPYYFDADLVGDWLVQNPQFIPTDQTYIEVSQMPDLCPNIEGEQYVFPANTVLNEVGECIVQQIISQLTISELLPNASGSDTNREFIEFYNPNDYPVSLADFTLQAGPQFEKSFTLPDTLIPPGSYYALTNAEVRYSLLNSSSRVRIVVGQQVISETPAYHDPKDDIPWALFEDEWQYVAQPTPGAANTVGPASAAAPTKPSLPELKPCASNQYRSPETNRCRLIAASTSSPKPCAANQERNPTTNRCRLIAQETGPAPCKEGQERNPDTNRCRTVNQVPQADYAVLGAQTKQEDNGWYVWIAVGLVVIAGLAYAAWEWRREMRQLFGRLQRVLSRR